MRNSHRTKPLLIAALLVLPTGACSRDVRLTGKKIRDVKAETVTHYGQLLDKDANPEQVVYVLLRAIKEDCLAKTDAEREAALDIQFDVAAGDTLATVNQLSQTRREFLTYVISRWAPSLSHYASQFESDWPKAKALMRKRGPTPIKDSKTNQQTAQVFLEVADPGGDPNASAIIEVRLVTEDQYWRASGVAFYSGSRKLRTKTVANGTKGAAPAGDG